MQQNLDDVKQYGRRLCLRIEGVTVKNNESADLILEDVKAMFEAGINVPDAVVDRAHRTGQSYTDSETKQKCKSIIIRFSTFRH